MAERKTIGQILTGFGRLTEEEVGRALEYQREHGGYFGEALLALEMATHEELEWSLASQYDLPYVFPDPDSIDPEAAALVSPEWALAHLTLPIARTDRTITVVVDSPIKSGAIDELAARTDRVIELALAPSAQIRKAIRAVYGRAARRDEVQRPTPIGLTEAVGLALDAASPRFGVSTRGQKTWFWYDDGGTVRRRPLEGAWASELDQLVDPAPAGQVADQARTKFTGRMSRGGIVTPVEVRFLADESGSEYLFRPIQERNALQERFSPPSPGLLSEIRLLARSGSARFVVTAEPEDLGREILPHLPLLLLDPSWRSIYINAEDQEAAEEAFSMKMPRDSDRWATELETLRAFHFDVVTVDLTGNAEDWAASALDVASVAFLLWPSGEDRRTAHEAGIRWELHVEREEGGRIQWSLEPLHV
ncbi:MAG: hypothetical protein KY453_08045 [Gemmatimonadetes bacterium]|nr:hypothetical protein [Gemmatimonadota bacterium]